MMNWRRTPDNRSEHDTLIGTIPPDGAFTLSPGSEGVATGGRR